MAAQDQVGDRRFPLRQYAILAEMQLGRRRLRLFGWRRCGGDARRVCRHVAANQAGDQRGRLPQRPDVRRRKPRRTLAAQAGETITRSSGLIQQKTPTWSESPVWYVVGAMVFAEEEAVGREVLERVEPARPAVQIGQVNGSSR